MNFEQAQSQFQQLEALRQSGQIDQAQYRIALEALQVVDERGVIWRMQEFTGAWYFFWEGQWVPYVPPAQPAQSVQNYQAGVPQAFSGQRTHSKTPYAHAPDCRRECWP